MAFPGSDGAPSGRGRGCEGGFFGGQWPRAPRFIRRTRHDDWRRAFRRVGLATVASHPGRSPTAAPSSLRPSGGVPGIKPPTPRPAPIARKVTQPICRSLCSPSVWLLLVIVQSWIT